MYLRSVLRSVRDETSKSFEIEKLELADEDKELFMRAWACHDAKQKEDNVVLAFDYFMILEMVASQYGDMALVSKLSTEEKQQIGLFYDLWRQRQAKSGGLISEQEASSFKLFFASIEIVIGENQELQRIYFPVPKECREQAQNHFVKEEMSSVMGKVKRGNAQEKLDDFLDKALQVQNVIQHQHRILSESPIKAFTRFITFNELLWVVTTFALTLWINIDLLRWVKSSNEAKMEYLTPDQLNHVRLIGKIHLAMSTLLFLNYWIGTAQVTVDRGFKWKAQIALGNIPIPFSGVGEILYKAADHALPDFVWVALFLGLDFYTFYYTLFLVFSVLGNFLSVIFFAFHVLDIAARIKLLGYVLKAVTMNINQVSLCNK
jgi:hypothetical protein